VKATLCNYRGKFTAAMDELSCDGRRELKMMALGGWEPGGVGGKYSPIDQVTNLCYGSLRCFLNCRHNGIGWDFCKQRDSARLGKTGETTATNILKGNCIK
jgi:hypothetical protein